MHPAAGDTKSNSDNVITIIYSAGQRTHCPHTVPSGPWIAWETAQHNLHPSRVLNTLHTKTPEQREILYVFINLSGLWKWHLNMSGFIIVPPRAPH